MRRFVHGLAAFFHKLTGRGLGCAQIFSLPDCDELCCSIFSQACGKQPELGLVLDVAKVNEGV